LLCVDATWTQKAVDPQQLGYGDEEEEATVSDSDDDNDVDDIVTNWSSSSPRSVRRAGSLEGPYSLLRLPLPSGDPGSTRHGSDQDSPVRSSRSLDQRLDELMAKGELGDGMSPPSSLSDQQSDVEESDSLSEEELDIIKLRKPVAAALQPETSRVSHSTISHPTLSDQDSSEKKSDDERPVNHITKDAAPLTDDMVDQIVRMKPMMARVTRQPSQLVSSNSPEDLSLKTRHILPVDLSSKSCSSEKVPRSNPVVSLCTSTAASASVAVVDSSVPASTPSTVTSSRSHPSHQSEELQATVTELPSSLLASEEVVDKRTGNVSSSISPVLPVPFVSSIQRCASPSGSDNSVITRPQDDASSCRKRASGERVKELVPDTDEPSTTSRYWKIVSWKHMSGIISSMDIGKNTRLHKNAMHAHKRMNRVNKGKSNFSLLTACSV